MLHKTQRGGALQHQKCSHCAPSLMPNTFSRPRTSFSRSMRAPRSGMAEARRHRFQDRGIVKSRRKHENVPYGILIWQASPEVKNHADRIERAANRQQRHDARRNR